jgi:small subunit ribosomal protein S16e
MGKDRRQRIKKEGDLKVVYTHGKKKDAVANAVVQPGKGSITINRIPLNNVEPRPLRIKLFEPILLVGASHFKDLKIKVRVTGGGPTTQIYAARLAIAKGLVAWKQKYVDEDEKAEIRRTFLSYDRALLVADQRRREPKKFGGPGARARYQKSYR